LTSYRQLQTGRPGGGPSFGRRGEERSVAQALNWDQRRSWCG